MPDICRILVFFIPELCISSFPKNLPPIASSYTVECFAIVKSIQLITNILVQPKRFLIITDSLSCFQSLSSKIIFKSPPNYLIINLLFSLKDKVFEILFLWFLGYTGVTSYETADSL